MFVVQFKCVICQLLGILAFHLITIQVLSFRQIKSDLPAIWAYCSSGVFNADVRKMRQKLNVTNATLVKVPF